MAVQNASIRAIPYTPVTAGLIEPLRLMRRFLAKTLGPDELREYDMALERAEQEAELINSRVDAIQTNLLSSQENQGGFLGLSSEVALPIASKGKAGVAVTGSRWDHVHQGVFSIMKNTAVFGAIRLQGNAVSQSGSTFTIDTETALVLEALAGTIDGVNDTFTITQEAEWLIVFLNGQATFDTVDWTLQTDNQTILYDLGYIPTASGSPPITDSLMALYSVKG